MYYLILWNRGNILQTQSCPYAPLDEVLQYALIVCQSIKHTIMKKKNSLQILTSCTHPPPPPPPPPPHHSHPHLRMTCSDTHDCKDISFLPTHFSFSSQQFSTLARLYLNITSLPKSHMYCVDETNPTISLFNNSEKLIEILLEISQQEVEKILTDTQSVPLHPPPPPPQPPPSENDML